MRTWRTTAAAAALALVTAACGGGDSDAAAADGGVSGPIVGAGSSTVLPVAQILIEEYAATNDQVTYDSIGSGGGFERLCADEVDFAGASRAIRAEEVAACEEAGVEFLELQFANDALTMVTSPETDYVECLTNEQVVQIFGPDGGNGTSWGSVVDGAPDTPIEIFAPDTDSGTYGFMVEDVMGLEESTQDYSASADDNVIVRGIESGAGTWGFFGLAYYDANAEGLKALEYDGGDGCVAPSVETAGSGEYQMTRPLFVYVDVQSLTEKPQVEGFVDFWLENATAAVENVGYIPSQDALDESMTEVQDAMS